MLMALRRKFGFSVNFDPLPQISKTVYISPVKEPESYFIRPVYVVLHQLLTSPFQYNTNRLSRSYVTSQTNPWRLNRRLFVFVWRSVQSVLLFTQTLATRFEIFVNVTLHTSLFSLNRAMPANSGFFCISHCYTWLLTYVKRLKPLPQIVLFACNVRWHLLHLLRFYTYN